MNKLDKESCNELDNSNWLVRIQDIHSVIGNESRKPMLRIELLLVN